jgi:hypothetical protein
MTTVQTTGFGSSTGGGCDLFAPFLYGRPWFKSSKRSVYSLRHTAICMRMILSHGKVNIFNLAKKAGTSVNQIERFYARKLPLSRVLAKNLQSFCGE